VLFRSGTPRSPSQRQLATPVTVNRIISENLRNKGFLEGGNGVFINLNLKQEIGSGQQAEAPTVIGVEGIVTYEGGVSNASASEGTSDSAKHEPKVERNDADMRALHPEFFAILDITSSSDENEQSVNIQTKTVKVEGPAGVSKAPKKLQRECNSLMCRAGELIVELDETISLGEIKNLPHFE
jgi:hypothetical protein